MLLNWNLGPAVHVCVLLHKQSSPPGLNMMYTPCRSHTAVYMLLLPNCTSPDDTICMMAVQRLLRGGVGAPRCRPRCSAVCWWCAQAEGSAATSGGCLRPLLLLRRCRCCWAAPCRRRVAPGAGGCAPQPPDGGGAVCAVQAHGQHTAHDHVESNNSS